MEWREGMARILGVFPPIVEPLSEQSTRTLRQTISNLFPNIRDATINVHNLLVLTCTKDHRWFCNTLSVLILLTHLLHVQLKRPPQIRVDSPDPATGRAL